MDVPEQCPARAAGDPDWWREAVVYQVYLRSFADGNDDGTGDIAGLRSRLGHLAALGVDALWINPWYPSPWADGGYDVADHRDVHPAFGTLAEAQGLIEDAHALGLRVLLDVVPNHTSAAHPWFVAALAGDVAARARYHVRPGRGPDGERPPNDWTSVLGGPAWTPLPDGSWYLHLFAPEQPDLNWENPEVAADLLATLRFWFDRGVDGFRIDVAHGLAKARGLPDAEAGNDIGLGPAAPAGEDIGPAEVGTGTGTGPGGGSGSAHPAWDQDAVHAVYRSWRSLADAYDPPRVFVAEAWVADFERWARYLRPDELHTAFQFDLLLAPWRPGAWRRAIRTGLEAARRAGAPACWTLSNHDVTRQVSRYARPQPERWQGFEQERARRAAPAPDLEVGLRRARAAALLVALLPGSWYVYQGEELGLEEVEDLPPELREDPVVARSGGADPGRDGCRVPLPWTTRGPCLGFSDGAARPWLPQPARWVDLAAGAQAGRADSTLELYRRLLALRRGLFTGPGAADRSEAITWVPAPPDVLALRRGPVECRVNFGADPVEVPGRVLVHSAPGPWTGALASDEAAWIEV